MLNRSSVDAAIISDVLEKKAFVCMCMRVDNLVLFVSDRTQQSHAVIGKYILIIESLKAGL